MTLNGQIIKQEWSNCDYILQLNPLIKINDGKPTEQRIPLENKSFTEDLQMLSLYLDSKVIFIKLNPQFSIIFYRLQPVNILKIIWRIIQKSKTFFPTISIQ